MTFNLDEVETSVDLRGYGSRKLSDPCDCEAA